VVLAAVMMLGGGAAIAASGGSEAGEATTSAAVLKKGSRGKAVTALQRKLGITADGVYGSQTARAVKRFQRRRGLTADGVAGPQTLSALGLGSLRIEDEGTSGGGSPGGRLEKIAQCESGGNPRAISAGGTYRGKYQFSRATWRAVGGKGDPAQAPEAEQDRRARILYRRQGPAAWPNCA
jgi:hypothetical protein